jgi:protein-tyrosine phosphatase
MVELDQIYKVHDNLYIGAYWPRLNFEKFKELGITAIVNLMEENFYDPTRLGFTYLHKGFPDDWYPPHSYLKEILSFRSGGIIVAWILKENPTWGWNDAMEYINKSRLIFPAIEIRESVLDYFESIEGKRRVF